MFYVSRKFQSFALAVISFFTFLVLPAAPANAVPASTYQYQFEGNTNPYQGSATLSLLGSCPSNVSGFTPCNSSTSFGTTSGDGYLAWSSTSARGGGFKILTPSPIGASYSMSLKFEFSNVSGYRKIVDYENYLSDNGFYLLSGGINFYPLGTSSTTYAANTILNLLVTRESAATGQYPNRGIFTVYVYSGSTLTQVLQVDDTAGSSLAANSGSGSLFGFFFDDGATSSEATPSGKVYDLKLWQNTALTAAQVGAVATAAPTVTSPSTPSAPNATTGSVSATVSVTAAAAGSSAPDTYSVTASPGGNTCTIVTPDTSCVVTGLTAGTTYTFTATATNTAGTSSASATSNSVTPTPAAPVTPGTPGTPTAAAGDGQATVTIVAPSSGGTPTSYTVDQWHRI
jgi:Fibronectin type III domain